LRRVDFRARGTSSFLPFFRKLELESAPSFCPRPGPGAADGRFGRVFLWGGSMKKALKFVQLIDDYIIAIAFIVMVIAGFAQVINRNLVGAGISWFEELARYCMIYMALLATEVGLRDGTQISVTAFVDKLGPRPREILGILAKLIVVVFAAIVFYTSFEFLDKQIRFNARSPGLNVPMYIPYFALTFSFALITLVQGTTLVMRIGRFFSGKSEPGKGGAA
jgi:TRAP-type C4-dicarboxylate transport system permease small subunit